MDFNREGESPPSGNTAALRAKLSSGILNGGLQSNLIKKGRSIPEAPSSSSSDLKKSEHIWVPVLPVFRTKNDCSSGDKPVARFPPPVPPKPGCTSKAEIRLLDVKKASSNGNPPMLLPKPRKSLRMKFLSPEDDEAIEDELLEYLDEEKRQKECEMNDNVSTKIVYEAGERSSTASFASTSCGTSFLSCHTSATPDTPRVSNTSYCHEESEASNSYNCPPDDSVSVCSGNMSITSADSALYTNILRNMGLLAKELEEKIKERSAVKETGAENSGGSQDSEDTKNRKLSLPYPSIPSEIGTLREKKPINRSRTVKSPTTNSLTLPAVERTDNDGKKKVESGYVTSSESFSQPDFESWHGRGSGAASEASVSDKETAEEEKDVEIKRKRKLRKVAEEFLDSEKTYVQTLRTICETFPTYISNAEIAKEQSLMPGDVVDQISKKLQMIVPLHQKILKHFELCLSSWNDDCPRLANVLIDHGQFLKMCSCFLRDKVALSKALLESQEKHPEFANAVKHFEVSCFKGLRLSDQLDCVHQRICRYPLLLGAYLKYLTEGSEEYILAREAKKLTEGIASSLEQHIVEGDGTRELLDLYRKLQGGFDVFQPGRKLLKSAPLSKQSRKEVQQRHLLLFSDCILYCRPSVGDLLTIAEVIWLNKYTRIEVEEHEDYKNEFRIISKKRSIAMVAKNYIEKKEWVTALNEALLNAIENQNRLNKMYKGVNSRSEGGKTSCIGPIKNSHLVSSPDCNIGRIAPVWIPDKDATMCQMCNKNFTTIKRKHHCRGCGKIICSSCFGMAPIEYSDFKKDKVCTTCFNIIAARERGHPDRYGGPGGLEKLLDPPEAFKVGADAIQEDHARPPDCLVDGYLYRLEKKQWKKIWAILCDNVLYLYHAPKDGTSFCRIILMGYELNILEETMFELRHKNQIVFDDSGETAFIFKSESFRTSQKWITAIREILENFY